MEQNRRAFLKTATGAALTLAVAGKSNSTAAEGPQPYRGHVIDTHTHFYDPTRPEGVPWPPRNDALLYRRVFPADYLALPKPQPVTGTVVVEASPWLEDNQWVLDLAAKEPLITGLVGNLSVGSDDFRSHLKRFSANPIFRGLRIGADRLGTALEQPRFLDDLRRLAGEDLALDLLGGPGMLPGLPRLAEAVPNLRMIIDHVANIRIDGKSVEPQWLEGMKAAAQHPNIYCKVSGLVEGSGRSDGAAPAEVEFYRPVLDAIWEAFGADRLVYGSNWPVSERFAPCSVVQQIVAEYFNGKSPAAAEKVLYANSRIFYKWIERS